MSTDSDRAAYRQEYEEFARTGGTDPTWYQRYSTISRYLADVRQRLRSRRDGSSLRAEDAPALPEWDIAEGDVDDFLEMVWRSVDNGVAGLGQGRVYDQHWESIQLFSRDGMDLAALTTAIIRDPEFETRNGRATEWFEAWREEPRASGTSTAGDDFPLRCRVGAGGVTSIVDRNHLFRFAGQLGLSSRDAGGSWYRMNELVLDRLQLPNDDPIMRNCYPWDLSVRLAAREHDSWEGSARVLLGAWGQSRSV